MATELVTTDSIIEYLQQAVEKKMPIPPAMWMDAAQKLNVLLGNEHELLFQLQQAVAQMRLNYLEKDPKHNVSAAKVEVEASNAYRGYQLQKAKCGRIEEFVRIAKVQAKLANNEWKGY